MLFSGVGFWAISPKFMLKYIILPYLILLSLFRWCSDPLRSVPGPFFAKCTRLWIILADLSGYRGSIVHKLHKQYGPVVRVSPNELCFASTEALDEIYKANSKYTKAPVYESYAFMGTFNTRDQHQYRTMKRRLNPSFNPRAMEELEPVLRRQICNLIKCLDKRLETSFDIVPWLRTLSLSVVGEGFIGNSFSGLETEKIPTLLNEIDEVIPTLWVWWMFPLLSVVLQHSPFPGIRRFMNAANDFRKYCASAYRNYLETKNPQEHHDLIARMVKEREELRQKAQPIPRHLTDEGIIDELTNMIFAGTDTIGNTLIYLFWELAHHPEWQSRLREELRCVTTDDLNFCPRYGAVAELPVLDAVLQETFRVHPAGFSGLLRLVPQGGATIAGVYVPPGVSIFWKE
ncbi:uncharacterized protein PV09_08952 [Verruconis gallopava]|uniref:Cytochrome P450 n=1 Tax=Verruconis gallopava TaxID=253628 RepID=A0A0D1ZZC1_9PEZI|nr:uncharacterized protein PV09_08952 [Verruconis gallopava]KIV99414.1 hypothetical protein PV09_08952 [Verruconis gallopava]